jgi:hypothetical protein
VHGVQTEWPWPISGVHSIMRVGGARPPPFTLFSFTYKVAVYASAERADTLSVFHLYPMCTLWPPVKGTGSQYQGAQLQYFSREDLILHQYSHSLTEIQGLCEFNSVNGIIEADPVWLTSRRMHLYRSSLGNDGKTTVGQQGRVFLCTVQNCKLSFIYESLYSMESTRPVLAFTHVDTRQVEKATTISVNIDLYTCR